MDRLLRLPAVRGGAWALLAATLFGLSTPLVQRFGNGLGPLATAALLYAGGPSLWPGDCSEPAAPARR